MLLCPFGIDTNEERTKEGFGHLEGTWHQAVLVTLAEALERMTVPCEICIHTRDVYVCSRIAKLEALAGAGWRDSKGELIKNAEEWQQVYAAVHTFQMHIKSLEDLENTVIPSG